MNNQDGMRITIKTLQQVQFPVEVEAEDTVMKEKIQIFNIVDFKIKRED